MAIVQSSVAGFSSFTKKISRWHNNLGSTINNLFSYFCNYISYDLNITIIFSNCVSTSFGVCTIYKQDKSISLKLIAVILQQDDIHFGHT